MGKRVDAIVVLAGIVFVLEFKVGTTQFDAAAVDQAIDYALDLKNFHAGSHDRRVVPLVVVNRQSRGAIYFVLQPEFFNKIGQKRTSSSCSPNVGVAGRAPVSRFRTGQAIAAIIVPSLRNISRGILIRAHCLTG